MVITITTAALRGVAAELHNLTIEVRGFPPPVRAGGEAAGWIDISGATGPTAREIGVRVRSGLEAAGLEVPALQHVTVTADVGVRPCAGWDLPIALAVARALGAPGLAQLEPAAWPVIAGEIGLDGSIRRVRGTFAIAEAAALAGRAIVIPREDRALALAAAAPRGARVSAPANLADAIADLMRPADAPLGAPRSPYASVDLADVRGLAVGRWALEVAAAGDHPLALIGAPGLGKSMLARRLPSIMPGLEVGEVGEVTRIYNAIGLADRPVTDRPFRAPHHTASVAALVGGGPSLRPGEVSLAHRGALFLDDWPEFQAAALEAIAAVYRDGHVEHGRPPVRMPAAFLLVAACAPCPCGWNGTIVRECTCAPATVDRWRARAAALCPVGRRGFDLMVTLPSHGMAEQRAAPPGETSAAVRARVAAARDRLAWVRAERPPSAVDRVALTIAALAGRDAPTADDLEAARRLAPPSPAMAGTLQPATTGGLS